MVMSASGDDPRDGPSEDAEVLDWSFQNKTNALLRGGRHRGSTFRRAILDGADLTEADFTDCDFRRASMVEADLMKSAFDGADLRGADLRKARMNLSNFRIASSQELTCAASEGSTPSGKGAIGGMPRWTRSWRRL